MTTTEARDNFADLIGSVYYTNEPVMVEKKGKLVAVVISPQQYEQIQRVKERGMAAMEAIRRRNPEATEEEVLAAVTHDVEAIRQEMYGQERHPTRRG